MRLAKAFVENEMETQVSALPIPLPLRAVPESCLQLRASVPGSYGDSDHVCRWSFFAAS